jgi:hypothetical protein
MKTKQTKKVFTTNKKTDLFDSVRSRVSAKDKGCTVIIPHVCNNINLFGAGFASAVASNYPVVKENFHLLGKQAKLGHTQFVSAYHDREYGHEIIFANMIAQNSTISPKNPRPLNYIALAYCLNDVRLYASSYKKNTDNTNVEIHCPKFGSGLAGGDWRFILQMLEDAWFNIKNIYIYSL